MIFDSKLRNQVIMYTYKHTIYKYKNDFKKKTDERVDRHSDIRNTCINISNSEKKIGPLKSMLKTT